MANATPRKPSIYQGFLMEHTGFEPEEGCPQTRIFTGFFAVFALLNLLDCTQLNKIDRIEDLFLRIDGLPITVIMLFRSQDIGMSHLLHY